MPLRERGRLRRLPDVDAVEERLERRIINLDVPRRLRRRLRDLEDAAIEALLTLHRMLVFRMQRRPLCGLRIRSIR